MSELEDPSSGTGSTITPLICFDQHVSSKLSSMFLNLGLCNAYSEDVGDNDSRWRPWNAIVF
ncbi:hypothetical protein BG011_006241 [Mortierella polycephala]|uniref:Uncharacterized protein n=1 Tax=Mortierella polycephala TaxID=41804 RepID=A0A9P6PV51_9FUNG|nr:hypothetical protein BG011_006241 [Mortierella polycephala]